MNSNKTTLMLQTLHRVILNVMKLSIILWVHLLAILQNPIIP